MSQKHHHANWLALYSNPDDLLQAQQALIDSWFDAWVSEQRAKAQELLRKRRQSPDLPRVGDHSCSIDPNAT
jgi:hypothetical protein